MKLIDEELLDCFRRSGRCEHCQRRVGRCEAAHVMCKGMGGGRRLDHRLNIVALCTECHYRQHQTNRDPSVADLLGIVGRREGMTAASVQQRLWELLRQSR